MAVVYSRQMIFQCHAYELVLYICRYVLISIVIKVLVVISKRLFYVAIV